MTALFRRSLALCSLLALVGTAAAQATTAEVVKIDPAQGKVTLKHGEIRNLDMPPMTMVFGVADPAMLDKVKQGDKIRFRAANPNGNYTITEIQAATP